MYKETKRNNGQFSSNYQKEKNENKQAESTEE